jgi:hypothetical protein
MTVTSRTRQALEGGTEQSAGMGPAFALQAGHLGPTDTAFFAHWHRLLDLEEGSSSSRRADMWRLPGDSKSPSYASAALDLMATFSRPQWFRDMSP